MSLHNSKHWQKTEQSFRSTCKSTVHVPEVNGDVVGHLVPQLPTGLVVVQQKSGEIGYKPNRVPAASHQAAIKQKTNKTKLKQKQNRTNAHC